jgi:hypothetical protein
VLWVEAHAGFLKRGFVKIDLVGFEVLFEDISLGVPDRIVTEDSCISEYVCSIPFSSFRVVGIWPILVHRKPAGQLSLTKFVLLGSWHHARLLRIWAIQNLTRIGEPVTTGRLPSTSTGMAIQKDLHLTVS